MARIQIISSYKKHQEGLKQYLTTYCYVEDNSVNIRLMEAVLSRLSIKCDCVTSAEQSFYYIKNNHVVIISMDINLPGISGF